MKFTRIQIVRFGALEGFDTGAATPLPGLVVVHGPNESGKSTFHSVLGSLVHGFYPASREANPFSPWSGGDIELRADLVMEDGQVQEVHRRLLSSPRGELVQDGAVEVLDNRSLPAASHVSVGIYAQVYAIRLSDLAGVRDEPWHAVRDHLVVGMGSDDILAPREVSAALGDRAHALWRPTRRGSSRHKELEAELKALRARREEAAARNRNQREALGRAAGLERTLAGLRTERAALVARLERLRALSPLRTRLRRLDELTAALGDPGELAALPRDPRAHLRALTERLEAERTRAEEAARMDRRIADAVESLGGAASEPREDVERLGADLLRLPLSQLQERLTALDEQGRRVEALEERLAELSGRRLPATPGLPIWAILAAGVGLVLLVAGLLRGTVLLGVFGGALLAGGAVIFARAWGRTTAVRVQREAHGAEEAELRRQRSGTEEERVRLQSEARALLEPFGFGAAVTDRQGHILVGQIERLVELLRERSDRGRSVDATTQADLDALVSSLVRAGGGPDEEGLRLVEGRLLAREEVQRIRAELEQEAAGPEAIRARLLEVEGEGEGARGLPDRLAEFQAELEALEQRIQKAGNDHAGFLREVEHFDKLETVDLVDGRMEEVREEMREAERERDRLFVLARVLDRAESHFRDAHQPELLQRAERHLARITGGRYTRILTGRGDDPHAFHLHAPHLPAPTRVDAPLSTGTREQVYFALRLAIVDHLDQAHETLPLLLDEVLVNWDPERRGQVLDLLEELSRDRQIFLFTCHPHLANEVAERGGRVVHLPGPTPAVPTASTG